jgi:phage shock protein A
LTIESKGMAALHSIIILLVAALGALAVWKRAALLRMFGSGRSQSAQADPMAVFQSAIDDGAARLRHAKEALEDCRSLLKSVQRQVESGEREKTRLESRIQAALAEGDPHQTAKEYAFQLAEVERQLAMNRQQLATHQKSHDSFAKQVEVGQQRLLDTRRKAQDLGIALKQSARERDMAQFASGLGMEEMQARVAPATEAIEQQIDQNRAAGRVAADLAGNGISPDAAEQVEREAEAAKILERFQKH